jgi:replicative DNA helicase
MPPDGEMARMRTTGELQQPPATDQEADTHSLSDLADNPSTATSVDLCIPELPDDVDSMTAALAYAKAGFYVGPVCRGTKNPGSVLGKGWQHQTTRDPQTIVAQFAGTAHGVFLHAGRSGAVIIDMDHPEKAPGSVIEALVLALAPFQSTRADRLDRGHYVFAQPPGRCLGNGLGSFADCGFEVRGNNGVIIVAPSVHELAEVGGRYRWEYAGPVPVLPDVIADKLPDASEATEAATDEQVREFLETHTAATHPVTLRGWYKALTKHFETGSRHNGTVSVSVGAMKEARAGFIPAKDAAALIRGMFADAATRPPVRGEKQRTEAQAHAEFDSILAWAVAQANAADMDQVRARTAEKIGDGNPTGMTTPFAGATVNGNLGNPSRQFFADAPSDDDSLERPIPLNGYRVDVPTFPVDALPEVFSRKVAELAEATQTDPAMAGTSALTTLAACVGGHAKVEVRPGWVEPLCLNTVTIARPGERKSAVQESMTRPLHEAEAELSLAGQFERMRLADELDMAKKKVDLLNKAAVNAAAKAAGPDATDDDKKTATAAAEAAKAAKGVMREIEVPVIPRLLADDVTPEAAATLLATHGGRIAIISAEGGIFDTIAGRYARTVNLDVFLKGHSGDRIRVDRQGRPPQYIPNPALTVGVMVQPRIIEAIGANRDFTGRGLLARFLYATPTSKVGRRRIAATPVSRNTEAQYSDAVKKLASKMPEWQSDPAMLVLDPQAEAELRRIEQAVETTLGGAGELGSPPSLTEWGAKFVGAIVRIAGLLHLAEWGEPGCGYPVQAQTIKAAERIGSYFKAVAINVFNQMSDPDLSDAIYLLTRVSGQAEVSERNLFSASSRPRFPTTPDMAPAINRLVKHGYLVPLPAPKPTGGRPASPRYKVHPLTAEAAQAAEEVS